VTAPVGTEGRPGEGERSPTSGASSIALLSVRDVSVRFGGIVALDRVSFDVPDGEIVGLIGPNGAGKTTLFNVITRLQEPGAGDVVMEGRSLLKTPAYRVPGRGIARTFQSVQLCTRLTVLENVLVGLHWRLFADPLQFLLAGVAWPGVRRREREAADEARRALAYVGLEDLADRPAAGLPFGTLKAVELARALVARPRLLMVDEPAGGLNHAEVTELGRLIKRLNRELGLTVLVVEHHMNLVMAISNRVVVLDFGRKIADGSPDVVRRDQAVIDAYLGAEDT
jgi:branched-chain amino acid transport system ATP-binding protein